jgi:hypothetical protein
MWPAIDWIAAPMIGDGSPPPAATARASRRSFAPISITYSADAGAVPEKSARKRATCSLRLKLTPSSRARALPTA